MSVLQDPTNVTVILSEFGGEVETSAESEVFVTLTLPHIASWERCSIEKR